MTVFLAPHRLFLATPFRADSDATSTFPPQRERRFVGAPAAGAGAAPLAVGAGALSAAAAGGGAPDAGSSATFAAMLAPHTSAAAPSSVATPALLAGVSSIEFVRKREAEGVGWG